MAEKIDNLEVNIRLHSLIKHIIRLKINSSQDIPLEQGLRLKYENEMSIDVDCHKIFH